MKFTQILSIFSAFVFISLLGCPQAQASSYATAWEMGKSGNSEVRLISQLKSLALDSNEILMGLEFRLSDGWHTYWKNAGDVGYHPKLSWELPPSWQAQPLFYPLPTRFPSPGGIKASSFGYEKHVIYPIILQGKKVSRQKFEVQLTVDYLACKDECVPQHAEFDLKLPVGRERESRYSHRLNRSFQNLPAQSKDIQIQWQDDRNFSIALNQFPKQSIQDAFLYAPHKKEIFWTTQFNDSQFKVQLQEPIKNFELVLKTSGKQGDSGVRLDVSNPAKPMIAHFWIALIFAFIGGFILNLMPCVLPVFFIKLNSLLKLRGKKHRVKSSLLLTIAGILVSFVLLATLTAILKSLGQHIGWGFQFQNPGFVAFMIIVIFLFSMNLFGVFEIHLPARLHSRAAQSSGSFLEGVFVTLLATPCSAPFLGTALSFALSQTYPILFLTFFVMGLGLSLPYFVFLVEPNLLKIFPRPGKWILHLKRFLGYSLLIAILWLLYVIQQQSSSLFMFAVISVLCVIFFFLCEFSKAWKWIIILLLSCGLIYTAEWMNSNVSTQSASQIKESFSQVKIQKLLADNQTLFINITADWCLTCKFNEATVIHREWFQNLLKTQHIQLMNIDWTKRDPAVEEFLQKYKRVGIPFSMIVSKDKYSLLPELLSRDTVEEKVENFVKK